MPHHQVLLNLRDCHRRGKDGTITAAGQLVHRFRGKSEGIVCGPNEVNLVTTARGEPLVGSYRGLITQLRHPSARVPAGDIHELCLSCRTVAYIPLAAPSVIVYASMYSASNPA